MDSSFGSCLGPSSEFVTLRKARMVPARVLSGCRKFKPDANRDPDFQDGSLRVRSLKDGDDSGPARSCSSCAGLSPSSRRKDIPVEPEALLFALSPHIAAQGSFITIAINSSISLVRSQITLCPHPPKRKRSAEGRRRKSGTTVFSGGHARSSRP